MLAWKSQVITKTETTLLSHTPESVAYAQTHTHTHTPNNYQTD